jgi:hypothetical protein
VVHYFPIISSFEKLENPLRLSLIDGPASGSGSGLIIQIQHTRQPIRLPCGAQHSARFLLTKSWHTDRVLRQLRSSPLAPVCFPYSRNPSSLPTSSLYPSSACQLRLLFPPLPSHPQSVVSSGILEPESALADDALAAESAGLPRLPRRFQ